MNKIKKILSGLIGIFLVFLFQRPTNAQGVSVIMYGPPIMPKPTPTPFTNSALGKLVSNYLAPFLIITSIPVVVFMGIYLFTKRRIKSSNIDQNVK